MSRCDMLNLSSDEKQLFFISPAKWDEGTDRNMAGSNRFRNRLQHHGCGTADLDLWHHG